MAVKTFQLHFSEEDLCTIREIAKDSGLSIKKFMLDAIQEKVNDYLLIGDDNDEGI